MDVTDSSLRRFGDSLRERGLSEGTVELYTLLVKRCAQHPRGLAGRLLDGDLAAKSLRANRAALMAWATFASNGDLVVKIKRIRLPPPQRQTAKVEFPIEQWKRLVHEIRQSTQIRDPMRATLLLISIRGLRCADALRLRRKEVSGAIRTGRLAFLAKGRKRLDYDATPVMQALELLHDQRGDWEMVEDLLVPKLAARKNVKPTAKRKAAALAVRRALRKVATKVYADDVREGSIHPHRFRRTQAVAFLQRLAGDPQSLPKLMAYMGWTSMDTALQYVDAVNRTQLDQIGQDMAKDLLR